MSKAYDELLNIAILGESKVGKSNLADRLAGEPQASFKELQPTIGADNRAKIVDANVKRYKLQMWDISGNELYRTITLAYTRKVNLFVLVYDVTNRESFDKLQAWYDQAIQYSPDANFLVIGNKADLEDQQQVTQEEAQAFAERIGAEFAEVSAKESPQQAFETVMAKAIGFQTDQTNAAQAINAYAGILSRLESKPSIFNDNQKRHNKADKLKAFVEGDFLKADKKEELRALLNRETNDTSLIDNSSKLPFKFFKTWSKIRGYENAVTGKACESKSEYLLSQAYLAMK